MLGNTLLLTMTGGNDAADGGDAKATGELLRAGLPPADAEDPTEPGLARQAAEGFRLRMEDCKVEPEFGVSGEGGWEEPPPPCCE
jgi:hypothetical protein